MNQTAHPQETPRTAPETSILAIGSLVASILGLTALPTVGSLIGLILGYVARREIRDSERVAGEGLATAGIILGWIGIALTLIAMFLVLLVIVFGFTVIPGITACTIFGRGF